MTLNHPTCGTPGRAPETAASQRPARAPGDSATPAVRAIYSTEPAWRNAAHVACLRL